GCPGLADARERIPAHRLRRSGGQDGGTTARTGRGQGPRGAARGRGCRAVRGGPGQTVGPREAGHDRCRQRGTRGFQGWRTGGWDHRCGSEEGRGAAL
ncbi:MAG: Cell division protein FtsL, partial [uncultured Rubrobacteraceae bacterium]